MSERKDGMKNDYLTRYPGAIQDSDKAHYIANVSNEKRSEAAGIRKFSHFILKLIEDTPSHLIELFDESSDDWIQSWGDDRGYDEDTTWEFYDFYNTIREEIGLLASEDIYETGGAVGIDSTLYSYADIANLRDYFERELRLVHRRLEPADAKAEQLEEWASVLYDNPNYHYTPEQMIEFEVGAMLIRYDYRISSAELEEVILKTRSEPGVRPVNLTHPNEYGGESSIAGLLDRYAGPAYTINTSYLVRAVHGPDSDEYRKITSMVNNPATTLGEIQAVYEDALRKLIENTYRESLQTAENSEKIVEEVRAAAKAKQCI